MLGGNYLRVLGQSLGASRTGGFPLCSLQSGVLRCDRGPAEKQRQPQEEANEACGSGGSRSRLQFHGDGRHGGGEAGRYPTRSIRLIIPFVPGGPSDFLSRLIGGKLSENLGQQIIPDNRGSAGGLVGFETGAHATPDGYTFLMAAYSGYTINPHVYKQLPYKVSELQPITQLTLGGNIIIINPSVNAKTLKEFIALAKSMPGKMNYASTGTGPLLATERFKKATGIDLVNIPYKGTGQAQIALLSNEVQFFVENPLIAVTSIKGGKVRALAVTSLKRNPVLPDLPTVEEAAGDTRLSRMSPGTASRFLRGCRGHPEQDACGDREGPEHAVRARHDTGAGTRARRQHAGGGVRPDQEGIGGVREAGEGYRLPAAVRVAAGSAPAIFASTPSTRRPSPASAP